MNAFPRHRMCLFSEFFLDFSCFLFSGPYNLSVRSLVIIIPEPADMQLFFNFFVFKCVFFLLLFFRLDGWKSEGLPLTAPAYAGRVCVGKRECWDIRQMAEEEDQQQACRYNCPTHRPTHAVMLAAALGITVHSNWISRFGSNFSWGMVVISVKMLRSLTFGKLHTKLGFIGQNTFQKGWRWREELHGFLQFKQLNFACGFF